MLGQRFICPIGPASQRIIIILDWRILIDLGHSKLFIFIFVIL